ncbi:MAG TPA: hypothetical protein VHB70_07125 [Parafilimonas sp.]|nr:hypothetical protein [Parafilimonas sp.]
MKAHLTLLAIFLFFVAGAQTKEKNWDVRLAIGVGTYSFLQDGGRFLSFDIFGSNPVEDAFNAGIFYKLKDSRIKLGLVTAYTSVKQTYTDIFNFSGSAEAPHVVFKEKIFAVMPAFNYSYLIKKHSQLYSEICAGPAFSNKKQYEKGTTENKADVAFQCTVLGYRFGNQVQAYTELGYGYKGILQAGVSYGF